MPLQLINLLVYAKLLANYNAADSHYNAADSHYNCALRNLLKCRHLVLIVKLIAGMKSLIWGLETKTQLSEYKDRLYSPHSY